MRIGCYCHKVGQTVFSGTEKATWLGDVKVVCHSECEELNYLICEWNNAVQSHFTHIKCDCVSAYFPTLRKQIQESRERVSSRVEVPG